MNTQQLRTHYAEVHARLMGSVPPPVLRPVQVAKAEERRPAPRPFNNVGPARVMFRDVLRAVCTHYGVTFDQIRSPRRDMAMIRPRFVAMYLGNRHALTPMAEIGRTLRRDHSTVIHGIERAEAWIEYKPDINEAVEKIRKQADSYLAERAALVGRRV